MVFLVVGMNNEPIANRVIKYNDTLYANSEHGLFRYDDPVWTKIEELPEGLRLTPDGGIETV